MLRFGLLATALALVGLLIGCGGERPLNAESAVEARVLLLGNGAEPRDLDPQTVSGVPEINILRALLEGLVSPGPTDESSPMAGVASHWEMSADGRVWTFHLRPEARWSNGDAVTSEDFAYAWRRALSPALACEYVNYLFMIEGAEAFHRGALDWEEVGVDSSQPHTLAVRLVEPTANFLRILNNHTFLPVHRATVEAAGPADARQTGWTRNFVGNGPFQLAEWAPNVRIRVEANPFYWNASKVELAEMHFFPIENELTEVNTFESGALHLTSKVPVNRIDLYRKTAPERIRFDDFSGVYFYKINTEREALSDPRVRHALSLALDRQRLIDRVLRGGERAAFGYTPDGIAGYATPQPLRYDPERARELLAEAGYPGGRGFPAFSILFNTSDNHRTMAEAIQAMWKEELGIPVQLENMEWKVYLDARKGGSFDVARAGWVGGTYVYGFLRNYESDSPNNETGFADAEYDRLLGLGQHELDREKRQALMAEAEERLLDALPIIPIYWYKRIFLIRPEVKGWKPKMDDQRPYEDVSLESNAL